MLLRVLCAAVLVGVAGSGQAQQQALDELEGLRSILDQETAALDALRQYHLTQQELIEWDVDMAQQLRMNGDQDAANAKLEEAGNRARLIGVAYGEFMGKYPQNPRGLTYYGEYLYDFTGEKAEAVRNWKLAERLDPELSIPLNNLGIHYCHSGDYSQGLRYFERTLELEPDNPDYLFNIVQIYLTNRQPVKTRYKWNDKKLYREAMKFSKRAAELDPTDFSLIQDYAVNFFAAEAFEVKVDWKEAMSAWVRARELATYPHEVFYTWLNEARAAIKGHHYGRARTCLEEALKLRPDSRVANDLIGKLDKAETT